MLATAEKYKGYRYPLEIIQYAVYLYYRFTISLRDVEEILDSVAIFETPFGTSKFPKGTKIVDKYACGSPGRPAYARYDTTRCHNFTSTNDLSTVLWTLYFAFGKTSGTTVYQGLSASLLRRFLGRQRQIAIDGKSLRGSRRHNLECLHSISAVCHETGLVLAEMAVEKKSNEITAIPLLLDVLALKGNTVTIDAAGCQQAIADIIVNKKANYVLALKKNHPKFYERVSLYCHEKIIKTSHCLKDYFDDSRGRCVRRRYFSGDIRHIEGAEKWAGLKSVVALETIRSFDNQEKTTSDWKYYLSSHEATNVDLPDMIRNHWSIENKLHWVLDVHLGEDNDRKSERRSAKAFAVLKRIALNVVRTKDNDPKRSLRRRFKMAGWDNDYLLKLLV